MYNKDIRLQFITFTVLIAFSSYTMTFYSILNTCCTLFDRLTITTVWALVFLVWVCVYMLFLYLVCYTVFKCQWWWGVTILFFSLSAVNSHLPSCKTPPPPNTHTHIYCRETPMYKGLKLQCDRWVNVRLPIKGNGWSVRVVSGLVIAVSGVCYFIKLSYWRDDWPGTS